LLNRNVLHFFRVENRYEIIKRYKEDKQ
jgi:hypothetical protein